MNTPVKLFIIGVGRSGTSLLQAMLGTHSAIQFLPETGFLRRYVLQERLSHELQTHGVAKAIETVQQDERLQRLAVDFQQLTQLTKLPSFDQNVYDWLLECQRDANCRYLGDKDPRLIESVDLLLALWPNSRLVHIFRDPRDVLVSKKKAAWSRTQGLFHHLVANSAQFELGRHFERKFGKQRLRSVCYESLLASPQQELTALCEWLGLEFESSMLNFGETASALTSPEEMQWKGKTTGPLLTGNCGLWRSALSQREVDATQIACRQAISAGDYTPASLSWRSRWASTPLGLLALLTAKAYGGYRLRKNSRQIACWLQTRPRCSSAGSSAATGDTGS